MLKLRQRRYWGRDVIFVVYINPGLDVIEIQAT